LYEDSSLLGSNTIKGGKCRVMYIVVHITAVIYWSATLTLKGVVGKKWIYHTGF